jgi:hypothetical protein
LSIPKGTIANKGAEIEVAVLTVASGGTVRLTVLGGEQRINDASSLTLSTTGLFLLKSAGPNGWIATGSGGGGGGSQGWADTLAIDPTSGANNPIVSAGQFLQLGAVGPATNSPQIRSGDATFRVRGGGNLFLLADGAAGTAALSSTAASSFAVLQAQGAGSTAIVSGAGSVSLEQGGFPRVVIGAGGEWTSPAGSNGQVWTHQGAGVPPIWAPAGAGGGGAATDVTATLPYAHKASDTVTVVDASLLATTKLVISWGTVLETDENNPEDNPVIFTATPAVGSFSLRISTGNPLVPVGGAYKIRYQELT